VKQAAIGAIFVIGGGFLGPLAEGLGLLGAAAADTGAAAADATADATSDTGDLVEEGCGESFTASTRVLLASGAAIPISRLRPGDKVLATNTKTGKTQTEPVTAVMVKRDTDKYDLTIRSGHRTAVIDTTRNHLFWDDTLHRWVKAGALRHGDHLRTPSRSNVTVVGGRAPASTAGWMWDISVPGGNDHDFYIDSTVSAVLVHNCPVEPYQVGRANELKARSEIGDQLDIHHVPQGSAARQVIPGYDYPTAPAIALPEAEHAAIPVIRGVYEGTAEDLIRQGLSDLQAYTNAPQSAIDELSNLIAETFDLGGIP